MGWDAIQRAAVACSWSYVTFSTPPSTYAKYHWVIVYTRKKLEKA